MDSDIDLMIAADRQKLEAFAQEARDFLDNLNREIEARLSDSANRLSQIDGGRFDVPTLPNFGSGWETTIGSTLGRIATGRLSTRGILRSGLNIAGRVLVGGLGIGSEGMRLSSAQAALEQSAALQKAGRDR